MKNLVTVKFEAVGDFNPIYLELSPDQAGKITVGQTYRAMALALSNHGSVGPRKPRKPVMGNTGAGKTARKPRAKKSPA